MKAVVFIDVMTHDHKDIEKELKTLMDFLMVDEFNYVHANVPAAIERIISEVGVEVVVTYGSKPEVQVIATEAGKLVIEYRKDEEVFNAVKTTYLGDRNWRCWNKQYYSLIGQ